MVGAIGFVYSVIAFLVGLLGLFFFLPLFYSWSAEQSVEITDVHIRQHGQLVLLDEIDQQFGLRRADEVFDFGSSAALHAHQLTHGQDQTITILKSNAIWARNEVERDNLVVRQLGSQTYMILLTTSADVYGQALQQAISSYTLA